MILHEIVTRKRERLAAQKERLPLETLKKGITRTQKDFLLSLKSRPHSLIAEFKRSSPSKGPMQSSLDLQGAVGLYNTYAQAISILTEEDFFGGSGDDLVQAGKMSRLPLLRKDFIIDPWQVYEARYLGADAILLIADILSQEELSRLYGLTKELGMEALIEAHREESLEKALYLRPQVIGINNRNLDTLAIDLNTTARLASRVPPGTVLVSESGFLEAAHLKAVMPHARAFLIGTAFMKAEAPECLLKEFAETLRT